MSTNSRRLIEVDNVPGPDFTTYSTEEPGTEPKVPCVSPPSSDATVAGVPQSGESATAKKPNYSHDGSFEIKGSQAEITSPPEPEVTYTGRGLACRAYAGRYWSTTLRSDAPNKREQRPVTNEEYLKLVRDELWLYAVIHPQSKQKTRDYLGYCPRGYAAYEDLVAPPPPVAGRQNVKTGISEIFLNDIYTVCKELYDVFTDEEVNSPSGLITITGATDSSKSLITRGLIFLFLEEAAKEALKKGVRSPHLVTFEDPIEQYFIKNPGNDQPPTLKELLPILAALNIDYTPRQKNLDADTLTTVIKDAKRQTPAVLFVGETREPQHWKELLDFGSSGHLVFTTAHSSSVVEAMSQILRNTKTQTPSQRSEVARTIRGIVNIRSYTKAVTNQDGTPGGMRALLPAVWKSTPQSVNNLVADGLSSILPALSRESTFGYYGRTHFAQALTKAERTTDKFKQTHERQDMEGEIVRQAMEWDIHGI